METMKAVRDTIAKAVEGLNVPVLSVTASDTLMSSVWVTGSFDPKENWNNGIFENSRYFRFHITPAENCRYYIPEVDTRVTVELAYKSYTVDKGFRKSTTYPERAAERIAKWLAEGGVV